MAVLRLGFVGHNKIYIKTDRESGFPRSWASPIFKADACSFFVQAQNEHVPAFSLSVFEKINECPSSETARELHNSAKSRLGVVSRCLR